MYRSGFSRDFNNGFDPERYQIGQDALQAFNTLRQDGLSFQQYSQKAGEIFGPNNRVAGPSISIGHHDPTERPPPYTANNASPGFGSIASALGPTLGAAATGNIPGAAILAASHAIPSVLNFINGSQRQDLEREKFEKDWESARAIGLRNPREFSGSLNTYGSQTGRYNQLRRR